MPGVDPERPLVGQEEAANKGVPITPHLQAVSDLKLKTEFAAYAGVGDITGEALDTPKPALGGYNKADVFPQNDELDHTTHQ